MIYPTLPAEHWRGAGFDLHGQSKLDRLADIHCAPVKLNFSQQHSTVRTDSAATHGSAMEKVSDVVILVRPEVRIELEDMLVIMGHKLRVMQVNPRFTPLGKHDHTQIKCASWG